MLIKGTLIHKKGEAIAMRKKVKGVLKECKTPVPEKMGYKDTWNAGKAANAKKSWKLTSPNRPSV